MGYWTTEVEFAGFDMRMQDYLERTLEEMKGRFASIRTVTARIEQKFPKGIIITTQQGLDALAQKYAADKGILSALQFLEEQKDGLEGCQVNRLVFVNESNIRETYSGHKEMIMQSCFSVMVHEMTHAADKREDDRFPELPEALIRKLKVREMVESFLNNNPSLKKDGEEEYRRAVAFLCDYQDKRGFPHEILPTAVQTICLAALNFGSEYGYRGFQELAQPLDAAVEEGMREYYGLLDGL